MNTITDDPPLGVNAMHAECPERKRFDYGEENGFFHCRHDFRLEQKAIRRTFQSETTLVDSRIAWTHLWDSAALAWDASGFAEG